MPRASVHQGVSPQVAVKQSNKYVWDIGTNLTFRRSASDPKFKVLKKPDGWRTGWQNNPSMTAGPRWTTGRYTFLKPPKQGDDDDEGAESGKKGKPPSYPRFRETYMQQKSREFLWVPGPGSYKSEREFMFPDSPDEVDTNITVQEAAPDYSFGREVKQTTYRIKNHEFLDTSKTSKDDGDEAPLQQQPSRLNIPLRSSPSRDTYNKDAYKFMRNHGAYPKPDDTFTPGPGTYNQFTSFGAASGGHQRHYLGGVSALGWDQKPVD